MSKPLYALQTTNRSRVGHPGAMRWIKAADLRVDRTYQRAINQRRVGELVAEWDDDAFGVLLVSLRREGVFIVDGQHRREGMLAMGLDASEAPCFVMTDLTLKEEADIYWRINKRRLQPGSADTFKARLAANEEIAVNMALICQQNGVSIMYYPTSLKPNEVFAIGAMERIYQGGDLNLVLRTIREGWPDQPSALRQDRLLGVWRLYQVFRGLLNDDYPEGKARCAHLIKRMQEFPPSVIVDKAIEYKTTLHSRPSTAFARALHFYFNFKIKTSPVKLPNWPAAIPYDRDAS